MVDMKRAFVVRKSSFYTEERKNLISSYDFEYFNQKIGEYRELKNINTKEELKNIVVAHSEDALGHIIMLERKYYYIEPGKQLP
jgi:hypothetical protein